MVLLVLMPCSSPAHAQWALGPGQNALPGYLQLPSATPGAPGVTVRADAGYGYTEAVNGGTGPHHRIFGDVAVALAPVSWFGAYVRFRGRYDRHPKDALGADDSLVGTPRAGIRLGSFVNDWLALGVDANAWFPGGAAPSWVPAATSFEARAVASVAPRNEPYRISLSLGTRVNQSAKSVRNPGQLRAGDRVSLGVGSIPSLLVGLAGAFRVSDVRILAEIRWNPWLGNGAPALSTSPLYLAAGARAPVTENLWISGGVQGLLSPRPNDPTGVLVPVVPRFSVQVGLGGVFGFGGGPPATEEAEEEPPPPEETETETETPAVTTTHVEGRVLDDAGEPVEGAEVRLVPEGADQAVAQGQTSSDGSFSLETTGDGPFEVLVEADGFEPQRVAPPSSPGEPLGVELTREEPSGILRGLVRNFSGDPLAASVRVRPGNVEVQSGEDGTFELELPPGRYQVQISAGGYRRQQRPVQIELDGVTVLNVELRSR